MKQHQSNHTGTVEDAARAVEIALASRRQSDGYDYSEKGSLGSPSPETRSMSVSSEPTLSPVSANQGSDYEYKGDESIPLDVDRGLSQPSALSLPAPVEPSAYYDHRVYTAPLGWKFPEHHNWAETCDHST